MNQSKTLIGLVLVGLSLALAPMHTEAALNDWAPLDTQSQAQSGFNWHGVFDATNWVDSVTNAANAAANTLFPKPLSGTVNFPAGFVVRDVAVRVTTPVASANGATAILLSIGDSTSTNRFISGAGIGTNITAGTWYISGTHSTTNSFNRTQLYNTATNLTLHLTPTGDSVPNINAGRFEVFMNAVNLNDARGN